MENFPDKISPMTLAAAIALGSGGGGQPSGEYLHYAGSITFSQLPALDVQKEGFVYDVTDGFTSTSDFTDGGGKVYPAGTNVAIVNRGTVETPVMKYDCMSGDFSNFVVKEPGKSLSTNDYTDADKTTLQNSPITVTATGAEITASTAQGNLNALTVYGKSEVVDGAIKSAGEGWATVDLSQLEWIYLSAYTVFGAVIPGIKIATTGQERIEGIISSRYPVTTNYISTAQMNNKSMMKDINSSYLYIKDTDYTTVSDFVTSLGDATLTYQLADPTQGNAIAIKTDNGSGINGTMATFSTGTPLRSIPDSNVRDAMVWNGSTGTVTKVCGKLRLADLTWVYFPTQNRFYATLANAQLPAEDAQIAHIYCAKYVTRAWYDFTEFVYDDFIAGVQTYVGIRDTDYNTVEELVASLGDEELIYELATPTTEQLTTAENNSIAGLRTFEPQTHAQNNAGATMTVEAYAGTENGKAVSELKQDVQSEISALKITQSATLTLTTAGWTNNAQTVTYAHDTPKRNVIDVDPSSVEEWASCGVLAISETATGITFKCSTVPENALYFRVTSMGVN